MIERLKILAIGIPIVIIASIGFVIGFPIGIIRMGYLAGTEKAEELVNSFETRMKELHK